MPFVSVIIWLSYGGVGAVGEYVPGARGGFIGVAIRQLFQSECRKPGLLVPFTVCGPLDCFPLVLPVVLPATFGEAP